MKKILQRIILWALNDDDYIYSKRQYPLQRNNKTRMKLLALKKQGIDIDKIGLRKLGRMIGGIHPQLIKHHRNKILENY